MKGQRRVWAPVLAVMVGLLAIGASGLARATTVLKVDVPEMTRTSEWVVRARVLQVESVDLRPQGEGLYTDVSLAIDEVYRGTAVPTTYVLRMMGGVGKDGMALTIPGMPRFAVGEEVVLFLEKTAMGHVPCGLGQGVWRVLRPPVGPPVVQQSTAGLNVMARNDKGVLTTIEGQTVVARTLADLGAEIRAVPAPLPATKPGPTLK
ncbi:MAG: hypothetical protein U1F43_24105 [Myxococcota bacterium]